MQENSFIKKHYLLIYFDNGTKYCRNDVWTKDHDHLAILHIDQYTKKSLLKPLCQLEQNFTFCYDKTENVSTIGNCNLYSTSLSFLFTSVA